MRLREWKDLPAEMRTEKVRRYYKILKRKKKSLICKRIFDIVASAAMTILLFPAFCVLSLLIILDSRGSIFYRQERVTQYGKKFKIIKFRTMTEGADKNGPQVTVGDDERITKVGEVLRRYRLDELPQLFNILTGDMTFVGTRPEVPKYVEKYTPEMRATLLLPAGVTSRASVHYKDEADLLKGCEDPDQVYVEKILPGKMRYNLESLRKFGLPEELKVIVLTVWEVFGRNK